MPKSNGELVESETRQKVRQMASAGLSVAEIARTLGITTQRVYQQLWAIRAKDSEATA